MLLSRFWYAVMAVALGAVTFVLFLAASMYDRASRRSMYESLVGDSQVVGSYLRDDARKRSTSLILPALDEDIRTNLARASASPDKIPAEAKDKVRTALRKQFAAISPELKFDAIFAVDQSGRVVAQVGFDQASSIDNFELGGYSLVADALHGWIRDDSWVLGGRIYRVVARPVENETNQAPVGAIVGARILDDQFARELSKRTGATVGFYASGQRVSSGAPEGFDPAQLDVITGDLKGLDGDPSYKEKGYSDVRTIHGDLGVVYARIVGEAWDVGAGYAVARTAHLIASPLGFLHAADDTDKQSVPLILIAAAAVAAAALGIVLTLIEHTQPLGAFKREVERFSKGNTDQLQPSKFRGAYRQLALMINEGLEKMAAKGGAPRRAADLDAVLGPIPQQPAMSAFSIPQSPQQAASGAASGRTPGAPASAPQPPSPAWAAVPAPVPAAATPVASPAMAVPNQPPTPVAIPGAPANAVVGAAPLGSPAPRPPVRAPTPKPRSPTLVGVAPPSAAVSALKVSSPSSPDLGAQANAAPVIPPDPGPRASLPTAAGMGDFAPPPAAPPLFSYSAMTGHAGEEDDEATVVSQVPNEILGQLSGDRITGRPGAIEDEATEWKRVFDDFVKLKKECGEPIDGISFEKFKNTLRKNRDQLLQRHGCKSVKFSVYVKQGKAALKANPVRS
jgi:hypothetical protein